MRTVTNLKNEFKFKKFELNQVEDNVFSTDYDDSDWREISIPHDWGIEGDFSPDNDPSYLEIYQDGITTPILHTGRTGALPTIGEGVYRKWVKIDNYETAFLEFDGIMWESHVYINGKKVGGCHFGYLSFEVDITDAIVPGDNLIAIHAIVHPASSRWYSGAGIYRNVRLVTKPTTHICYNGVWVRQIYADSKSVLFDISVTSNSTTGFNAKITTPKGLVYDISTAGDLLHFQDEDPALWDIYTPNLYTATITLDSGDSVSVRFGARSCEFTPNGFFLNGKYTKMNGVCMHHDMGCIGTAINRSALERQLDILKSMGVNAIRTSHNPPAPELLELCDEQGILVIDEFFDEWVIPKVPNGYHKYFKEHAVDDLKQIMIRDRNHPCVIMWSIGNEIAEQKDPDGWKVARMLSDSVHKIDPTRPSTAGLELYHEAFNSKFAFYMDVIGLNYKPHTYGVIKEKYPNLKLVGSETASCISTRGVYQLPAVVDIGMPKNDDLTISDYGLSTTFWAYYAEREICAQQDHKYVMGEFVWTGFDYIGEPTPYYTEWPSRSSYFGAIDLAGLPKNRYYLYRSAWSNYPTLHIFPHWNWEGKEGTIVPVHIYTNYEEVELFINGVSYGKKRHSTSGNEVNDQLERFRLMWNDTVYQPGEICAVAYVEGKEVERKTIKTAGEPYAIKLSVYKNEISADTESLNYVTATIVDKYGNVCPNANNRLYFLAEGCAKVYATDAGDQREVEGFLRADKKALSGMLVCCLRSDGKAGKVVVKCKSDSLIEGIVQFACK